MKRANLITISSFFAALTFLGAQLALHVGPVPITFQTFFVILAGLIAGSRAGLFSQLIYLALGLAGVPVFAGFKGGLAVLNGPTAGYLLSFPIASFIAGLIFNPKTRRTTLRGFVACLIAEAIVYGFGLPWLIFWLSSLGGLQAVEAISRAITMGALIFIPGDALKIGIILYLINRRDFKEIMVKMRGG